MTRYLGVLCGLAVSASVFGATLVLPNSDAAVVGNDASGSLAGSLGFVQFQDIWDHNQFASVGAPISISQIAWRAKPNLGSINVTATSFTLSMSTTAVNASTISPVFAANRGADFTQVLSGSGTWASSPGCTGAGPCPFDMVFNLSTPFLYNPAAGNLLIEMQVSGLNGAGTGQFDVQSYAVASPIGEVVSETAGSSSGVVEFSANVTRVTFANTPEPATYGIAVAGLAMIRMLRKRKR